MPKYLDQLTEDTVMPSQQWCCISFLSPETVKNCNFRGVKVRGVYATKEEAVKRCEFLQKIDPDFNIFVGEVGKWLGWDPDPNSVDDQVYREKKLNEIMNNYKKGREKAQVLEEERKRAMLEESVRNEALKSGNRKQKKRDQMRHNLEKKRLDDRVKTLERERFKPGEVTAESAPAPAPSTQGPKSFTETHKEEDLKKREETITADRERITKNEDMIQKSRAELSSVDENLNKLQAYYKELVAKRKASSAS